MSMAFEALERVYEQLAEAIDRVGPQQETVFLAKVALALANCISDRAVVETIIADAERDLPRS